MMEAMSTKEDTHKAVFGHHCVENKSRHEEYCIEAF